MKQPQRNSRVKRFLVNTLKVLGVLIIASITIYLSGPKPSAPLLIEPTFTNTLSLSALEKKINTDENNVPHIKPECHARIVWNDTTHKEKTKYAVVYLHGFSASRYEGQPVDEDIAKTFHANLYEARLSEHGIAAGDSTMVHFNADDFYQSGEAALNIAKQLGDSVIVIGTSAGGALGLFLAARHPEIKALVAYSPCIRIFRKDAALLAEPWGLKMAQSITGKKYTEYQYKTPERAKYWVNRYALESTVQFANFLKYAMTPKTFEKVKCPVFMGYYYADEEHQDKVVSVPAMKEMFRQLGTPANLKRAVDFPTADEHVIACDITSGSWQQVEIETKKFLSEIASVK